MVKNIMALYGGSVRCLCTACHKGRPIAAAKALAVAGVVIFSPELALKFKMEEQDFTRKRKQSFSGTLLFMFNFSLWSVFLQFYPEVWILHLILDRTVITFHDNSAC
jgi:hypothetical protein